MAASRFNKRSIFRLARGTEASKSDWYSELRPGKCGGDCNEICANATTFVFPSSSNRSLSMLPLAATGKHGATTLPTVAGHSRAISALAYAPFEADLLATGSEDATVRLWRTGDGTQAVTTPEATLSGLSRRIDALAWNPVASNVLVTASGDPTVAVWDVSAGDAAAPVLSMEGFGDAPQSVDWSFDGRQIVVTCKDKVVRVFDPRAGGEAVLEGPGHYGLKGTRALWLGDSSMFITTGFDKYRGREMYLYDVSSGSLDAPLARTKVDSSTGILMPLFDPDTKMLFLVGKGDTNIRFYEVNTDEGSIMDAATVTSSEQTVGACLVPKTAMDVWNCEVARILRLTSNGAAAPLSWKVPRKSYAKFHPDVFPDTRGTEPGVTGEAWFEGADGEPARVSLEPEGERPVEVRNTQAPPSEAQARRAAAGSGGPVRARKWSSSGGAGTSKWGAKRASWGAGAKRASWTAPPKKTAEEIAAEEAAKAEAEAAAERAKMREIKVPKNIVRASKFRHIFGEGTPTGHCWTDIRLDTNFSGESATIAAGLSFFAVPWTGTGGQLLVLPTDNPKRVLPDDATIAYEHTFLTMAFNPFNPSMLATGSDDSRVCLWMIPDGGIVGETVTEPDVSLRGHGHRVTHVEFHPWVEGLLTSMSFDNTIRFWDVEAQAEMLTVDGFPEQPVSLAWGWESDVIFTTCKDKALRAHDPRANTVTATVESAHVGVKPARVVALGNTDRIATVGFGVRSAREIKVWDIRNLEGGCIAEKRLDTSSNLTIPLYDIQTGVLFISSKGDGIIRTFEINDQGEGIHECGNYSSTQPTTGLALVPKARCDIVGCNFASFLKMSGTSVVEPIKYMIPRSRKEFFQDDVFVPCPGFEPLTTAADWAAGTSGPPPLTDLCPEGMPLLSDAPKPKQVTRKFVLKSDVPVDTRTTKEKLMDSFESKLDEHQGDVLPQDAQQGADEEDWEGYGE